MTERERDEWKRRAEYAERELSDALGLPSTIGPVEGEARRIVDRGRAALAERDRLRRELEALRDDIRSGASGLACRRAVLYGPTVDRIDAILSGGES